jgi:hypothetical protein
MTWPFEKASPGTAATLGCGGKPTTPFAETGIAGLDSVEIGCGTPTTLGTLDGCASGLACICKLPGAGGKATVFCRLLAGSRDIVDGIALGIVPTALPSGTTEPTGTA